MPTPAEVTSLLAERGRLVPGAVPGTPIPEGAAL
jgi:5-dehydro-2-deoxygluconokinase